MRIGLMAGSVAAIAASLVSLPLRSPNDLVFNTATVSVAAIAVGIAAGAVWPRLAGTRRPTLYFSLLLGAVLILVALTSLVLDAVLAGSLTFSIPTAATALVLIGVIVPLLSRGAARPNRWAALAVLVIAAIVGIALAGQCDQESGELALPLPSPTVAPTTRTVPAVQPSPAAPSATAQPSPAAPPATAQPSPATPSATATAPPDRITYVVGEGSETTFTVREELVRIPTPFDAVIRTTELSGEIDLAGGRSIVTIDLHTLSSDEEFRDRYIRRAMFPNSPTASFTVDGIDDVVDSLSEGETITRSVEGTLGIRGIEVPLTFEVEARLDGNVLHVLGRTTFTWEQLEIPVPTARSVVSVADEVRVEVLLRATSGE